MKKFFIIYVSSFCFIVVAIMLCNLFAVNAGLVRWHFAQLYQYQVEKVEQHTQIDILFVGDSSLGNAIDARFLSNKINQNVVSLALTGVYGYAGSLNMLRRTLRRHKPKLVVVFQTTDMFLRKVSHEGLLYSLTSFSDLFSVPLKVTLKNLATWQIPANMISRVMTGSSNALIENVFKTDYIPQGETLASKGKSAPDGPFKASDINPEKSFYLKKIAKLCAVNSIKCVYVHGPLTEPLCQQSRDYINAVNNRIAESGFKVVPGTPLCMPWDDVGDSSDHVRPEKRIVYTQKYLKKLERFLPLSQR